MKIATKVICYLVILSVSFFVFSAYAKNTQSSKVPQKTTVTIIHNNGSTIKMTNFCTYLISHSYASRVFTDVPTSVKTSFNSIELQPVGPQMPFSMLIPFEIIKDVRFELKEADTWFSSSYFLATVTLGDGQIVKGRFFGNFEGETSLGKSSFTLDSHDYKKEFVQQINFEHVPKTSYTEKPWGKHSIILHKLDGTALTIEKAAFLKNINNRNYCWIGEKPTGEMDFESSGLAMKVQWNKIGTIVPTNLESQSQQPEEEVLLTTKDGTQFKGRAIRGDTAKRIKGIFALSTNYKIQVDISLMIEEIPPFAKIEFK